MDDDWYDDIAQSPEEERRDKIRALISEVLDVVSERPITMRTVAIDFDARTVSIDGRVYGPIPQAGFVFPLIDGTRAMMPSRTHEPW